MKTRENCKNVGSSWCADFECNECPVFEPKEEKPLVLNEEGIREFYIRKWHERYEGTWAGYSPTDEEDFVKWSQELIQQEKAEVAREVLTLLDSIFEQKAFTDYHVLFDTFRQSLIDKFIKGGKK